MQLLDCKCHLSSRFVRRRFAQGTGERPGRRTLARLRKRRLRGEAKPNRKRAQKKDVMNLCEKHQLDKGEKWKREASAEIRRNHPFPGPTENITRNRSRAEMRRTGVGGVSSQRRMPAAAACRSPGKKKRQGEQHAKRS